MMCQFSLTKFDLKWEGVVGGGLAREGWLCLKPAYPFALAFLPAVTKHISVKLQSVLTSCEAKNPYQIEENTLDLL